jgi:hypothetical protein
MFLVFVATVLAGSLGAIHYVIVHIIMGKPFAEVPPPVVVEATRRQERPAGASDDEGAHADV